MPSEYTPTTLPTWRARNSYVKAATLLTAWYLASSIAVILTKTLFSGAERGLPPFPFGLTVTATNNIVAYISATLLLGPPMEVVRDNNVNRIAMVIGATTAAEIGLSNIALNLLSVSYATVLKGMAPFFVMAWGVLLGIQKLQLSIVSTMFVIAIGLGLAVIGENSSDVFVSHFARMGFFAQLVSGILSGFRWMLTQVFIKGDTISNDTFSSVFNIRPLSRGLSAVETIRLTAPYTLLWIMPFVVVFEGWDLLRWILAAKFMDVINLLTVLLIIGVCVYALLWTEYELVKVTSSLTVSIGFVMKEVVVIFAGAMIFNDKLSTLTCTGFAIVQCGVVAYALLRREQLARDGMNNGLQA